MKKLFKKLSKQVLGAGAAEVIRETSKIIIRLVLRR